MPARNGIAVWGAPTTGKTTFLAALASALEEQDDKRWRLRGRDRRSAEELGRLRTALVHHGKFPAGSLNPASYNWELVDPDHRAAWPAPLRWLRRDRTVRIPLNFRDAPGRFANPELWPEIAGAQDIVDHLGSSAGIIFFYDPIREAEFGDVYLHVSELLALLDQKVGGGPGGWLPQYLAVCLTKFDEDLVFESARRAKLVSYDYLRDGAPFVDEGNAEDFFVRMCRISPNPAAESVPRILNRHFHPERIRFFVTSAIGFYVDTRGQFNPADSRNVIREPGKEWTIRGAVHPLSVVEPVVWLTENLKKGAQ